MEGHSSSTQQWEVVRGTLGSLNSPHLEHLRLTGLWVWMLVAALLVVMLALPLGPDFGRSPLELAAALATFSWPGGERAEVREQLLQNVCLLLRLHPSMPMFANETWKKDPERHPAPAGWKLKGVSALIAGWGTTREQSSLLWLHQHGRWIAYSKMPSDTINQALQDNFRVFPHWFLITSREYLPFYLKTKLHHLNALFLFKRLILAEQWVHSYLLIQEACKQM